MPHDTMPYHLTAKQWLEADVVMENQASQPLKSRPSVCDVVNHIHLTCFTRTFKTPTTQAIKKRYQTYFLGAVVDQSLVEQADAMMELWALNELSLARSLSVEVKNTYFPKSPSTLHTIEAIEDRYRSHIVSWNEADQWMKKASTNHHEHGGTQFRIGQVAEYVKETYYSTDALVSAANIQDRYCKLWLRLENVHEVVEEYDNSIVAAESMIAAQDLLIPSRKPDHLTLDAGVTRNLYDSKAFPHLFASRSENGQHQPPYMQPSQPAENISPVAKLFTAEHAISPTLHSYPYAPQPSSTSHKRVRPNSFDSHDSTSYSYRSSLSNITNFSRPILRIKKQLRDSGFFSLSSASDEKSLLSRMSRLSVEVKLCLTDHSHLQEGSFCTMCCYPQMNPKPIVYVAGEYAKPPHAEDVDADDLDNGNMRRNANARF